MFEVFHNSKAENEILAAAQWYNLQRNGLGDEFIEELEKLEHYISLNPFLFPEKYKTVRQATMKRFPYVLLLKVEQSQIFILSVFNCYQDPKKKKASIK